MKTSDMIKVMPEGLKDLVIQFLLEALSKISTGDLEPPPPSSAQAILATVSIQIVDEIRDEEKAKSRAMELAESLIATAAKAGKL